MFYVLVAGKRDFTDYERFQRIMDESLSGIDDEIEIVEGGATGADSLAKRYALEHGYHLKEFKAMWNRYGRSAGPVRNVEMTAYVSGKEYAKAVFFWDGKSKGTGDCLRRAKSAGIRCEVHGT